MPQELHGYWIDLNKITLSEGEDVTWMQAFPLGSYEHPRFGTIEITPERVQKFAANVKGKIRGVDLDIDYDHKTQSGEAAGWIQDAEAKLNEPDPKRNGLWIGVRWTDSARQKIKEKAYRYFSPEYVDKWTHPKTSETHQDVLCGGALTNRPFLSDILPINLSELTLSNEGGNMDPKELAKLLGLSEENTTPEAITAALNKLVTDATAKPDDKKEGDADDKDTKVEDKEPQKIAASEDNPELKKLAEDNPAIAKLLADQAEDRKRMATLEAANRLSEVTIKLSELNASNKDRALAPKVLDEIKAIAVDAPKEVGDRVFKMLSDVLKDGIVELKEVGGKSNPGAAGETATKKFSDAVDKLIETKKLSYPDAVEAVGAEDPALWQAYSQEVTSKQGV